VNYIIQIFLLLFILTACSTKSSNEATDKYRLIWNADPKTTMTIAWNQNKGKGYVRYGLSKDVKKKVLPQRQNTYRGMNNNFVRLKGLTPNSRYYFNICTENNCSKQMYFKTAPDGNESFTFISGGDSRSIVRGRVRGNILVSKIRPLFIAHGGDYTSSGTDEEWSRWLDEWQLTKSPDGRVYPLILTHGNHENRDLEMLHKLFDIPHVDAYYKIDFHFMSLYILNTEIEPYVEEYSFKLEDERQWKSQKKWLERTLKKDKKQWKVISYHRPLRPHRASKPEGKLRYSDWSPLFYKYGVELAIESDSHLVKYTQPLKPDVNGDEGFSVDHKAGTTYIGEGSWGAPTRENDDDKSWTIDSAKFWQFKLVTVDVNNLAIRTVKFGDEDVEYDALAVHGITQNQQNNNPKVIPDNLDIWESKGGKVLLLKK
jgi:hypothetical protein